MSTHGYRDHTDEELGQRDHTAAPDVLGLLTCRAPARLEGEDPTEPALPDVLRAAAFRESAAAKALSGSGGKIPACHLISAAAQPYVP